MVQFLPRRQRAQRGILSPFRSQRGGWISGSVPKPPGYDMTRWLLARGRGRRAQPGGWIGGKRVLDLFSKQSHHRNISVMFLCQDLFTPGKFAKIISRNAHYIVAFKNPRDQVGMRTLTVQAFPNDWSHVMNIFGECTQRRFGYLMLDLHPASDDRYRLLTNVLPKKGPTETYERQA